MLSFFEAESDPRWPEAASPQPPLRHCFSDLQGGYSSAMPVMPAAAGRKLPSTLATIDLVKGRWLPGTRSNSISPPSSNSTSSSADPMKNFGSRIFSWQDCNAFPRESPSNPSLAPFLGGRNSTNMAMDTGRRNHHDAMVDWRKQKRSIFYDEESTTVEARDPKRQKTTVNEEERPCQHSFKSTSSPILKAPVNKKSQKIGDKITALQQLVSPFGKTDTASVLHEATVCIKVLHEQIKFLSKPFLQSISPEGKQGNNNGGEQRQTSSLRGIGLCMIPISLSLISR